MKAIVSHDIDHLTLSEHYFRDLIVPKFFVRSHIELLSGKISLGEFHHRLADVFKDKWQHLEELHHFNSSHTVPATYFIGVCRGEGLSYSLRQSAFWIQKLQQMGCEVGPHSIAHESREHITKEYDLFKKLSGSHSFGTRMHYIRQGEQTFAHLANAGYAFDSSEMAYKAPYKVGNMWEFPFQIMDSYIIEKPRQWQSRNFGQCCDATRRIIDEVARLGLPYLGIDFHDRYFSPSHKTWKDWYMWLIEYLASHHVEFVSFATAIDELEHL